MHQALVPPKLGGAEIRERFLKFYEQHQHVRLPSSSLIPDDPTVLLTIAGMLQFKAIFMGQVGLLLNMQVNRSPYKAACSDDDANQTTFCQSLSSSITQHRLHTARCCMHNRLYSSAAGVRRSVDTLHMTGSEEAQQGDNHAEVHTYQ